MDEELKSTLYACLNTRFREFPNLDNSFFPPDEFNTEEAESLCQFCLIIREQGYDFIEKRLAEKTGRDLLDLAAEYGVFTDARVGESYLGVFIVGQMLMEPYGEAGFCERMMRSGVYRHARPETKHFARFLMLLATFIPGKYLKDRRRETMSEESVMEVLELKPASLDLRVVARMLAEDLPTPVKR